MKPNFYCITLKLRLTLTLAMVSLVVGLTTQAVNAEANRESAVTAMRTLGQNIPANGGDGVAAAQALEPRHSNEPGGVLTLGQALALALRRSPELEASSHEVWSAEATARQAAAFPNPELEFEAEEFGGSGNRQGNDGAVTTVRLSQSVALGGKRGKRQNMARSEARLANWAHEVKRLDVIKLTKQAFADVLLAQGQVALNESLLALTEEVRQAVAERVKAGKVSLLEESRASIEVAAARIERDRSIRELETARRRLAAFWGGTTPVFEKAEGEFKAAGDVPLLDDLSPLLDNTPEVARWNDELTLAEETVALARAERLPDLGVSVGISRFEEDGTHAGTVALSLPLPVFDRNAGGIIAAQHQTARVAAEQRAARIRLTTDLMEAHNRLATARSEAQAIETEMLPGAQQAFDAAQTGYRDGKFGYLELLESQRKLGEVNARRLNVIAACHKAAADVERLTGTPLNSAQ